MRVEIHVFTILAALTFLLDCGVHLVKQEQWVILGLQFAVMAGRRRERGFGIFVTVVRWQTIFFAKRMR